MVITAIARVTFLESIRSRVLYLILLFAVVFVVMARVLGYLSSDEETEKMIIISGLSGMTLFGFIIAVFSGMSLIHKELEQRTVYTILSKPVGRHEFILGKYTGLMSLLILIVLLMGTVFTGYFLYAGGTLTWGMGAFLVLLMAELSLVTSIAIFFALVASPIFSAVATFCLFVAGYAMDTIFDRVLFLPPGHDLVRKAIIGLHMIIPNFYNFNITDQLAAHMQIPVLRVFLGAVYGLLFSALFLYAAILVFNGKRLQ
jgi:Cu-processing system permease protein